MLLELSEFAVFNSGVYFLLINLSANIILSIVKAFNMEWRMFYNNMQHLWRWSLLMETSMRWLCRTGGQFHFEVEVRVCSKYHLEGQYFVTTGAQGKLA